MGVGAAAALGTGLHCREVLRSRNVDEYNAVLPELASQGIRHVPLIWSCYGAATQMRRTLLNPWPGQLRGDADVAIGSCCMLGLSPTYL